jgi:UDPglucose--hexose-1-phosphate uridylyltransferase
MVAILTVLLLISTGLSSLLLKAEAVTGKCYVLAFSPAHNLTLADLSSAEMLLVIDAWTRLYTAHISPLSRLAKAASAITISPTPSRDGSPLRSNAQYRYMQIFENKGAAMGCSNPHPHGQIWVTSGLPHEAAVELAHLTCYRRENEGKNLLEDYAKLESEKTERVVFGNRGFLVVCPWWAIWPFEVMIIAKKHKRALVDLDDEDKRALAEAISDVLRRYDNLFETQFPYSMGIHQAPLEGSDEEIESSHFHIHFYPPLLRSATVRKFLVGYAFSNCFGVD